MITASLKDRVAIITGAGQGIGRAFAKAFATQGAIAVIAERNRERGEAVAAEIAAAGGTLARHHDRRGRSGFSGRDGEGDRQRVQPYRHPHQQRGDFLDARDAAV
jgi:NAD(P)-dependent dehydrogenase (short-subunit alcohol dehydrogenase family)